MNDAVLARAGDAAIRVGSKSFAAAARLFDREMRDSAVMLYAWCRLCDDTVDGQASGHDGRRLAREEAEARLARLEALTRAALDGEPAEDPAFAGLQAVARRHAIPRRYPLQHLDGYRMDVAGRRYATLSDTLDYCYHVAGVVGVMMGHVMGVRDPETLDRASDLGIAFQLTNIARDVVEDAANGRVYLPADWLAEAGLDEGDFAEPRHREGLATVVARLLAVSEPYYDSAAIGIRSLPPRAAWAVATAQGVYRQIGLDVLRRGARAWDERVSTSTAQKLRHVALGAGTAVASRFPNGSPRRCDGLYARPDL
ncbi:MAG: phytoene/squalene synthase family protein [Methylobacteriaceae bacterium]|nr:phytoene/squalene synthase family protein [Methylobacteriaceae bacterium]